MKRLQELAQLVVMCVIALFVILMTKKEMERAKRGDPLARMNMLRLGMETGHVYLDKQGRWRVK